MGREELWSAAFVSMNSYFLYTPILLTSLCISARRTDPLTT